MNRGSPYMKLIFYIFLFSQLLNFLGVFAEKRKESSSGINPVKWEKVEEKFGKAEKEKERYVKVE